MDEITERQTSICIPRPVVQQLELLELLELRVQHELAGAVVGLVGLVQGPGEGLHLVALERPFELLRRRKNKPRAASLFVVVYE
jgi:hypothetical protein